MKYRSLIKFSLLAFLLYFGYAASIECTENDYTGTYTECFAGSRHLIWYWKPGVDCSGGVELPPNVYFLPCDVTCGEGEYLPLGATNCSSCPPGTFSIGGGYRVSDWEPGWNSTLTFKTYCLSARHEAPSCSGWSPDDKTFQYITSGKVNNSESAVLELTVQLISPGQIHFEYSVSAEPKWDGLTFVVNGEVKLPLVSTTRGLATFKISLPIGYYVLQWIYSKDFSTVGGDDLAAIRMIEIGGLTHSVSFCSECSPGTFNDQEKQEDCMPCPQDHYSNSTALTQCVPCNSDEYAYPGSTHCEPRLPCTENDYEVYYTSCVSPGTRMREYRWIEPRICDNSSISLPQSETIECDNCNPGTFRSTETFNCTVCPVGYYSVAGATNCTRCPAGTAAAKGRYITQWSEWEDIVTTGCTGDCGSHGWRLLGSRTDSGYGHGTADSWLQVVVFIESTGTVKFNSSLICTGSCRLEFTDEGYVTQSFYTENQVATYNLRNGTHVLRWTFKKIDPLAKYVTDHAEIYSIVIIGTATGGAGGCLECSAGTHSDGGVSYCSPCDVGQQSAANRTVCQSCPANTFNPTPGQSCINCGHGTVSTPNRTDCDLNGCKFSPLSGVTYDLSTLARQDEMYGPVYDQKRMSYYLNICSKQHHNHTCYDQEGRAIRSFACQITTAGWGVDLGSVIGFYPLPSDPTNGLIVNFDHGTPACGNPSLGVAHIPRTANITFYCDPLAGIGSPTAPLTAPIEGPICHYNFAWSSLYACPLCSASDYTFELTECRNGYQRKIYYWTQNPRRCHGGAPLPADETVSCTLPSISCASGSYLQGDRCVDCPSGTYSIGGGFEYDTWEQWPEGFTTTCTGVFCTSWTSQNHSIVSGIGNSSLIYTGAFVTAGSVSFSTKVYAHKHSNNILYFYVDQVLQFYVDTLQLEYTEYLAHIPMGGHTLEWRFTGNEQDADQRAYINRIRVKGTSLSATQCTPCPSGTFSSTNRSTACNPCAANTYSIGGAVNCTACAAGSYSLAGSNFCKPQPACTANDYQGLYTACHNGNRTLYYVPLEPKICKGGVALPKNSTESCPPCVGDSCNVCPPGHYFDGGCKQVPKGSAILRTASYFSSDFNKLPDGWSTGCSGSCGSPGWRIRGTYLDSGSHDFDPDTEVDTYVQFEAELLNPGSIQFEYTAPQSEGELEFFMDGDVWLNSGKMQKNARSLMKFSVSAGYHVFTWNYHLPASPNREILLLGNVVVVGTSQGVAQPIYCPPGTFTGSDGQEHCSHCDPGYASSTYNSTQCAKCPKDSFAADPGSTQCRSCGTGTYTESDGAAQCTTNCQFSVPDSDVTYSLEGISPKTLRDNNGIAYHISVCAPFTDNTCRNNKTYVCMDDNDYSVDFGNYLQFEPLEADTSGFALTYTGGDTYACTSGRSTTITFVCNPDAGEGIPQLVSTGCAATIIWTSIYGCKVCTKKDYDTVTSECSDGKQSVAYIRNSDCNGLATKVGDPVSCSVKIQFPIAVVVIAAVAILVVVVVAVIIFVNNRRLKHRYELLQAETVHKNVELDTVQD